MLLLIMFPAAVIINLWEMFAQSAPGLAKVLEGAYIALCLALEPIMSIL